MKSNLLKIKITIWYTGLLAVVVAVILIGVVYFAENHIVNEAKAELKDEVSDFYQELYKLQDISAAMLRGRYYDDGVVLSIYNKEGEVLEGVHPDEFPVSTGFEEGSVREIHQASNYWVILDRSIGVQGEAYWIRGIYTLDLLDGMSHKVFQFWAMLVPVLLFLIGMVGYRMIRQALDPVYNITKMADDISKSNDLALRLPEPITTNELSYMTQTFNYMLENLEDKFQRETQFTSDAAHELRTPISVISSHCEYCLEELEMSEELREELLIINKKAHIMSELISQLLMIARAESGTHQPNFEEVDLEILAESVVEELQEKAEEREIQLYMKNLMKNPQISCDINLIMQVMMNLVENAIHYGRDGGRVELTLDDETGGCMIQVRDDGMGIPLEEIDKIWDRFYRVDASHSVVKGFGLGLFMVKWIVEMHNGWIEVKSFPDLGSIFTVHLPENPKKL